VKRNYCIADSSHTIAPLALVPRLEASCLAPQTFCKDPMEAFEER